MSSDVFEQCNCNGIARIEIEKTYLRVGEWDVLALRKKVRARGEDYMYARVDTIALDSCTIHSVPLPNF